MMAENSPAGPPARTISRPPGANLSSVRSASLAGTPSGTPCAPWTSSRAGRLRERLPVAIALVLGEAEGVLAGIAECRAVDGAGNAAADVAHDQLQGAADRGVGAVALAQRIDARIHADLARHRAVDDDQG